MIRKNLENSFPEKTTTEIKEIIYKFRRNFCDTMVESIKCFSISENELRKRVTYINPDVFGTFHEKKQSIIIVLPHYTNWEIIGIAVGLLPYSTFHALYKPLKNKNANSFVRSSRERYGLNLLPAKTVREVLPKALTDKRWHCFGFVADQLPRPSSAIWLDFLNQKTAFYRGAAVYAQKYNLPIVYGQMSRIKRGHYEMFLKVLCEKSSELSQEKITELHVRALEKQIIEKPENWLWSHKRWKYKFEDHIRETPFKKQK